MKTRTKILSLFTLLLAGAVPAGATITFDLIGGQTIFSDNGTTLAPANSLVLLVADTTGGGFGNLSVGNISIGSTINAGGNDLVIDQLSIDGGNPGLLAAAPTLTLFGNWTAGDALAVYWIPSLTVGDTNVGANVAYGFYTDASISGDSAAWITPADGSNYNPIYFSTNSTVVFGEINAVSSAGYSSLHTAVVPEPSVFGLFAGFLALGAAGVRRWRKR